MNSSRARLAERAAELRQAFDQSFAEPRRSEDIVQEDFLILHVGAEKYAIRCAEIAGVFVDKKITTVPGQAAYVLGLAGFRGNILPVHDLRLLLGQPAGGPPRWLAVAAAAPIAFAFDDFDGQRRIVSANIVAREGDAHGHISEYVQDAGWVGPVLNLASLLGETVSRAQKPVPKQER
jgi:purine-binding chemotaxis protein CheW